MGKRFRGKVTFEDGQPAGGAESRYPPPQKIPPGFPDRDGNFTDAYGREFGGVKVITGNESPENRRILDQFAEDAKKEGLKKTPLVITFDSLTINGEQYGDDATAGKLADGTTFVAIPYSLTNHPAAETNLSPDPAMQKRQIRGVLAHEAAHVKQLTQGEFRKKDRSMQEPNNPEFNAISRQMELDANSQAVKATCDAEALLVFQQDRDKYLATFNGQTLGQYYASQDPATSQPLPQTSNAQLEYMKEHPPKGCKVPKPRMP